MFQIICLDLSEEMSVPKLESFNGYGGTGLEYGQLRMHRDLVCTVGSRCPDTVSGLVAF